MKKKTTGAKKIQFDIIVAVVIIVALILIGATFYKFAENLSWLNAFYFATMTIVTVGFGDFAPTHSYSRLFTILYALISIPAVLFCLGIIVEDFIKQKIGQIEEDVNGVLRREQEILKQEEKILQEEKEIEFRMKNRD